MALLADLAKKDTPEEAFVRGLVESNFKKDWNYGYEMLLCVPHHTEQIERLIEREPTKSRYCEMKADTLVKLGEDQQALLWYERVMRLDTPNAYRYCKKGDVLARLDRAGEAMECYEKVISLEPDDIDGYAHKARLLEQLGRGMYLQHRSLTLQTYKPYKAKIFTDIKRL